MKQYLILTALATAAACHAQGPLPSVQRVAGASSDAAQAAPAKPAGLRQLSVQERAELRRQLYQYSRVAGKGS